MHHTLTLLALLTLGSLPLLASAKEHPTHNITDGGISVTDTSITESGGRNSSTLTRLLLENKSPSPRSVSIFLETYSDGPLITTSLSLQPGAKSLLEVPLPLEDAYIPNIVVKDDTRSKISLPTSIRGLGFHERPQDLYASPSTKPHVFKELDAKEDIVSNDHYNRSSDFDFCLTTAFADPWPSDYRAYFAFLACLLTAEEFDALPAPAQSALFDYVAAGGTLLLFHAETQPTLPFAYNTSESNGVTRTSVGLGQVLSTPLAHAEQLPEESSIHILHKLSDHSQKMTRSSFELDSSVTQKATPPVTRTALVYALLVLFSILAGPILLFRLARRNQRLRILRALPTLSAIFSLLLVISFFLSNGITPHLALDAVTFLDQRAGRALTRGAITLTTPLSLRHPIEVPRHALLTQQYDYSIRDPLRTHLAATQQILPRIVRSGIPFQAYTRTLDATHRRLEFTTHSGSFSVRNLLGATLTDLTVWDDSGHAYHTTNLAPGDSAPLQQKPDTLPDLTNASLLHLPPKRSYYAVLESDCPFLSDPLPSTTAHRTSHAIIQGLY